MNDSSDSPQPLPALDAEFTEMTAARTSPDAIRSMTFRVVRRGFDQQDVTSYLDRLAGGVELLHDRIAMLQEKADRADGVPAAGNGAAAPAAATAPAETDATPGLDLPEPPATSPYEELSSRIAEVIRRFDEEVRRAEAAAKDEAEQLIAAARAEADEINREARLAREEAVAVATTIVAAAKADAERTQRDAQVRADELEGTAQRTVREAQARAEQMLQAVTARRDALVENIRTMRAALAETLGAIDTVVSERSPTEQPRERLIVVEDPVDDPS